MRIKSWCVFLWFASFLHCANAQSPFPSPFLRRIVTAFSNEGKTPASVILSGTASWIAGSQRESGTMQLQASSDGSVDENWSFGPHSHTDTQGPLSLPDLDRKCVYTDANGKSLEVLGPNCLQGVPWFFPSFALEPGYLSAVTVVESDPYPDLKKLVYSLNLPSTNSKEPAVDIAKRLQKATTTTIFYDAQSALPKRLVYRQALDGDESRGLEVSIEYSDYKIESGFMIPHHMQRYLQRTLQVDFIVSGVTVR